MLNDLLCGCGKEARYAIMRGGEQLGCCNKYARCLTCDEALESLKAANLRLLAYQKAVNQIDDYFEYSMESKKDQKKAHQILGNLADALKAT